MLIFPATTHFQIFIIYKLTLLTTGTLSTISYGLTCSLWKIKTAHFYLYLHFNYIEIADWIWWSLCQTVVYDIFEPCVTCAQDPPLWWVQIRDMTVTTEYQPTELLPPRVLINSLLLLPYYIRFPFILWHMIHHLVLVPRHQSDVEIQAHFGLSLSSLFTAYWRCSSRVGSS